MKRLFFSLCAGAVGCALALQFPPAADAKSKEKVLHSFGSGTDGVSPEAGLIDVNGTLYGTTGYGGTHCQGASPCGTVFALDAKTGAETVLYSFCSQKNCADGQWPTANLIDVNGTLYGTTTSGGTVNCDVYGGFVGCGTVFKLDVKTGAETVVHSFGSGADGAEPYAGLIDVNGTLYGTTAGGGANCRSNGACGTVFALDPNTGAETVFYSFCAQRKGKKKCSDGSNPVAGLIDMKGSLYGTTQAGGAYRCLGYGCGTVFALDPNTGAETVLHSFGSSGTDGTGPSAGLIDVKSTLYGTTSQGGSSANQEYCVYGCGTVFSLDPGTGVETVLYAFCSRRNMESRQHCKDGQTPNAGLIDVKGTLYGTTLNGGAHGWGILFALDPNAGAETVLHAFGSGSDGAAPNGATLIDVTGALYGTTAGGGVNGDGDGTVFALRP